MNSSPDMLRRTLLWSSAVVAASSLVGVGLHAEEPIPFAEGVYWRVNAPKGPPSFILGTIHVGAPCEVGLRAAVDRTLGLSRIVFLEVRLDATTANSLNEALVLPADKSLPDLIGRDTFNAILPLAERRGIQRRALERLKPWVALRLLEPDDERAPDARQRGRAQSLDKMVFNRARSFGREVRALEAIQEQIVLLDAQPSGDYATALSALARSHQTREPDAATSQLIAYYNAERVAPLLTLMERRARQSGHRVALRELRSLNHRNTMMVTRAMADLRKGAAFIAVGALHLPGEQGILRQLETLGFKITREDQGPALGAPNLCRTT